MEQDADGLAGGGKSRPVEDFKMEILLDYARHFFVYNFNSRSELAVRTLEALVAADLRRSSPCYALP
jgi:hypothetical protein